MKDTDDSTEEVVSNLLSGLQVTDDEDIDKPQEPKSPQHTLICDAGYAFPREARPRKEKVNAIARQLANFLEWQMKHYKQKLSTMANIKVVGCQDENIVSLLKDRTKQLLNKGELPNHVTFESGSLTDSCSASVLKTNPIYLSPDAQDTLDPSQRPPDVCVVGLLIDRRVQPNRSKERALKLEMLSKRWPLEQCFSDIDPNEPLNVDCVLEGMQQW